MNLTGELETILPELLVTDLINDEEFRTIENKFNVFSSEPINEVKARDTLYKQKTIDFFTKSFLHVQDLFKLPNEPIIFSTDYRYKVNSTNIALSICYLESLLQESSIALSK
jgi:hypothetical protein